jgi:hypothetical protein
MRPAFPLTGRPADRRPTWSGPGDTDAAWAGFRSAAASTERVRPARSSAGRSDRVSAAGAAFSTATGRRCRPMWVWRLLVIRVSTAAVEPACSTSTGVLGHLAFVAGLHGGRWLGSIVRMWQLYL